MRGSIVTAIVVHAYSLALLPSETMQSRGEPRNDSMHDRGALTKSVKHAWKPWNPRSKKARYVALRGSEQDLYSDFKELYSDLSTGARELKHHTPALHSEYIRI